MFRFLEISLFGWDLWPQCRVPVDRDVVLLTGPNGSGKTTFLDAIRQLLNAPRLSSRRRLQNYLRRPDAPAILRAIVSNDAAAGGTMPFQAERIITPEVTLACALVPTSGGAPEKRFAVLPGRVEVAELRRALLDSRDYYPPEQYSRALERAGVTRSLMGVLAIEQGRTNSLFELSARDLFLKVLEMMGDRPVLERYREARRRYRETDLELSAQLTGLHHLQAQLNTKEREVRLLDEWIDARDKVAELDARLPAARLQMLLVERQTVAGKIPPLRTRVRNGEAERTSIEAERERTLGLEREARAQLEQARQDETDALAVRDAALEQHARLLARLEDLDAKAREAEAMDAADLTLLETELERASRTAFTAEHELSEAQRIATEARERVERLRAGMPDYPQAVRSTLAELSRQQTPHRVLAETVSVRDANLAEAAEAALGDARYALLVDSADEASVLAVAQRHRFPGPVYSGSCLDAPANAGALELEAGAPAWLGAHAQSVSLSADGSFADARGTWTAGTDVRVLGATARQAALKRAERALGEAKVAAGAARVRLDAAQHAQAEAQDAVRRERRRQDLLAEVACLPAVRAEVEAAELRAASSDQAHTSTVDRREQAHRAHEDARLTMESASKRVDDHARQLEGERQALEREEAEVVRLDARIAELEDQVSPELADQARRGELDGEGTVQQDLLRARSRFEQLPEPPAAEVREEARHLRINIREAEQHADDRRRELEGARSELGECRRRYLDVVSAALGEYRARAVRLGSRADVQVQIDLPRLADEDRVLDEARIEVRLGFDGKEPLALGHPSFSGGQQVVCGLILLMAMAETDGRGFFILDEPFAHLSIDRVDDVGRFLKSARAQFLITAPTTLDRAQLDPASMVVVLSKKRPDAAYAPPPIVAVA
jgi:chromosome segregation protein